jgi:hypothetical protein
VHHLAVVGSQAAWMFDFGDFAAGTGEDAAAKFAKLEESNFRPLFLQRSVLEAQPC